MSIFVLHFGQSNLFFFLGGSCMSENLKTWGKCANPFFTCVSYFLLNANNTRYNFCVLHFWRKVKVNAYRTDLPYNVINEPFSLVYR